MASVTIENMPDELLERIRQRAQADKHSMSMEVIGLLEKALSNEAVNSETLLKQQAREQAAAWLKLAGRWQSDLSVAEEIEAVYESRTQGRKIDL
jgi:plasmid stability protein